MKVLASNSKYLLLSTQTKTDLLSIPAFTLVSSIQPAASYGSLQYETGIAALARASLVSVHDFQMQQTPYSLDTYQPILNIHISKNLLIIISASRILIHDVKQKCNQCYIPLEQGLLSFVLCDYYRLRVMYFNGEGILCDRSIWTNQVKKLEGVRYAMGAYAQNGQCVGFALQNVLSIYQGEELMKVYGLDTKIVQLCTSSRFFFVLLQNGSIIGSNQKEQIALDQFQMLSLEYRVGNDDQQIMFVGEESVFLLSKVGIKSYPFLKAKPYSSQSKPKKEG